MTLIVQSHTILTIIALLSNWVTISCGAGDLFKLMSVSGSVWTKYIFRTDEYAAETIVECGSICQVEGVEGCHVFRYEKDTWKCHVGKTDNANTNYLATQSGSHNVYMRIGIGIFLSCSFNIDGMDCLCLSRFYD